MHLPPICQTFCKLYGGLKRETGIKAHDIAQDVESSNGSWVHAYLHRVEGDLGNAAYWYSRAGRPAKRDEDMNEEWKEIAQELVNLNI